MIRNLKIEVTSNQEFEAISRAMRMPDVKAFCVIVGTLEDLQSDKARERVLKYVSDLVDDDACKVTLKKAV